MSQVIGLPVPEPERYVNRAQLAELMGVSVATVDRMVADGMPSERWGRRVRRFRPSTALAWARSRDLSDQSLDQRGILVSAEWGGAAERKAD